MMIILESRKSFTTNLYSVFKTTWHSALNQIHASLSLTNSRYSTSACECSIPWTWSRDPMGSLHILKLQNCSAEPFILIQYPYCPGNNCHFQTGLQRKTARKRWPPPNPHHLLCATVQSPPPRKQTWYERRLENAGFGNRVDFVFRKFSASMGGSKRWAKPRITCRTNIGKMVWNVSLFSSSHFLSCL